MKPSPLGSSPAEPPWVGGEGGSQAGRGESCVSQGWRRKSLLWHQGLGSGGGRGCKHMFLPRAGDRGRAPGRFLRVETALGQQPHTPAPSWVGRRGQRPTCCGREPPRPRPKPRAERRESWGHCGGILDELNSPCPVSECAHVSVTWRPGTWPDRTRK